MDFAARPFDVAVDYHGKFLAIEGKFQKSFNAFGMKKIRDSQIANLNAITKGQAFIFLYIWVPNQDHRLLIWEWEEFKRRTETGSIKKHELMDEPFVTCKNYIYNVEQIVDYLPKIQ